MLNLLHRASLVGVFCALVILSVPSALAQFSYGGGTESVRAAGPMISLVDFSFQPENAPDVSFAFEDSGYGVFYRREGFLGHLFWGTGMDIDGADLVLVEGSVDAWGALRFTQNEPDAKFDLYFPVGFHGDYRKVTKKSDNVDGTVFEVSVAAIGAGLGLDVPTGSGVLSMRSKPFFGIASRAFGTETGTSAGLSIDVDWSLPEISSRVGAYLGWGYRWQRWLMSASSVFAEAGSDNIEYRSRSHVTSIGLTF